MYSVLLLCLLSTQNLGDNAALRYWSAFAQMRQDAITPGVAKQINAVLSGEASYSSATWKPLLEANRLAVDTLARGARLDACDWGIEYELGGAAPIEYSRKALALGRLNALWAIEQKNQRDAALRTIAAGLRFARHTAEGGTLFAALAAKSLILAHLQALRLLSPLTPPEKASLALDSVSVDWTQALTRELDLALPGGHQTLKRAYLAAIATPDALPTLERELTRAPADLVKRIPRAQRVIDEKKSLQSALESIR